MKLKDSIVVTLVDDTYMAIDTNRPKKSNNIMIKNNETANYIFTLLKNDTTEKAIVDAMCKKYDAPRDIIAEDVRRIVAILNEKGFIEK